MPAARQRLVPNHFGHRVGANLVNLTRHITPKRLAVPTVTTGYALPPQSNPLRYMSPTRLTTSARYHTMKDTFTIPTPQELAKPLFPDCDSSIYGLLSIGSGEQRNFVAIEKGALGTTKQIADLVMNSCGLYTLPEDDTDRKWLPLTVLEAILQYINQCRHTTFPSLFPRRFKKTTDSKGFPILHPQLNYSCIPYGVDPGKLLVGTAVSTWIPLAGVADVFLAVMDHLWYHWLTHKETSAEQQRWLHANKSYLLYRSVVTVSRDQVQQYSGSAELAVIHQVAADVEHDGLVEFRRLWYTPACDALRQSNGNIIARRAAIVNLLKDTGTPLFDFLETILPWICFNRPLAYDITFISDSNVFAIGKQIHPIKPEVWPTRIHRYLDNYVKNAATISQPVSNKHTADGMETNVSEETDLALLRGVVNQLVTIITRYSDILDYFPVQRASCQLYPVTSLADQKKAFELDQIEDSNAHKHFNAAWKQRKVTAREFGPVVVAGDRYRGFKQSLGHQIVKNIMSHHAPNTKLMLIVGAWKSDNSHRFKDLVSPFAPVTTVSEFRTSITSAVSGKITSASCEIPKKTYKYNGREWTGRISELYGYSNQAAMRARVRYIPGGGSINRDINGAAGIVIQSLHVSAMTAVSWQQNLGTLPVEQYYHPRYQRHSSRAKPNKRSHGYHMHQVQLREDARWRRFAHNASEREMLRRQILDDSVQIQQSIASAKSLMAAAKERLKNALVACAATKSTRRWRAVRDVRDVRHEAQQIVKYQRAIRNLDARHEHNVKRYMFLMGHVLGNTSIRQYIAYKERQRQAQPIGDEISIEKTENDSNEIQQNVGKMEIVKKNWKEIKKHWKEVKKQKAKPRKALELDFSRKFIDVSKQMRTFPIPAKKIYRYLGNKIKFDARAHDLAATNHEAASQTANGCAPSANLLGMFVGVVFYGKDILSLTPSSLVTNPTASFNSYGVRKVTFNSLPKLRGLCQQFEQYNFVELLKIDSSYWGPHKLANPGYLNAVTASGAHTLKEVIEDAVGQGITLITSQSTDSISSDTPVGNEKNKAHGSLAIGSGTVRNAMMYLGKLASICTTASITVDYLDLYNSMYKQDTPLTKFRDKLLRFLPPGQRDVDINNATALAHTVWPQIYPFSTIMFTDDKTYNNAAGYYKTLSYTNVKNELIFKKLLPKLSKQLRGLVFAVIAINSNDKVKLNELWNIVCKQPGIEQLTAQQEAGVIKKAGIPDVEVDDIQDEDDDEEEVEDDDGKKVFVDNNNIPLRELLKTNPQFTVGVNSKLKDVVEGVVSVFVDQFGKDVVNFARRKRCHKQIGNAVDCSKVLVALYAISFFQASFFLGLDKTGRFIPDADRSHYAQMLAIDNYNNVPTVTSAREVTADFMQLLRKRFPVLRVLPAVPGDHKTTNIKVDHYLSLGKVSDNAPKKIKKRKTK